MFPIPNVLDAALIVSGQILSHAALKVPRDSEAAFRAGSQMRETGFRRTLRAKGIFPVLEEIANVDSTKWRTFALAVVFETGRQQILLEKQHMCSLPVMDP